MSSERFSIAQVTPYAWETHHEVNRYVERLADELCARGHRVVVVAPSDSRELVRESRALIRRLAADPEALLNTPVTAHILGGAVMGGSAESGVIDRRHRVFGYENLLVCDGSAIPANPGVNPSLTITAMTEYAMSHVPAREGALAGGAAGGAGRS